jgi:hypothetical protein
LGQELVSRLFNFVRLFTNFLKYRRRQWAPPSFKHPGRNSISPLSHELDSPNSNVCNTPSPNSVDTPSPGFGNTSTLYTTDISTSERVYPACPDNLDTPLLFFGNTPSLDPPSVPSTGLPSITLPGTARLTSGSQRKDPSTVLRRSKWVCKFKCGKLKLQPDTQRRLNQHHMNCRLKPQEHKRSYPPSVEVDLQIQVRKA